jgi:hypothetical protein
MTKKRKKEIDRICKNCRLYDEKNGICGVNVMISGEAYELPVLPNDSCHWERVDREVEGMLERELANVESLATHEREYFKEKLESEKDYKIEVKQIRTWSDGKDGYIEEQL